MASEEVAIGELLQGQVVVDLTYEQVDLLVGRFGLPRPFRTGERPPASPPDPEAALAKLEAIGVLENGQVSAWFRNLWSTVSRPTLLAAVERVADGVSSLWVYPMDRYSFAEQIETEVGFIWLFGVLHQLVPRVLLNSGLLRHVPTGEDSLLDPLPNATSWKVAVRLMSAADPSGNRAVDRAATLDFDGQAWFEEGSPLPDAATAAARIAAVLGADEER